MVPKKGILKMILRKAEINDAAALAEIVCCAWRAAFGNFIAEDELSKITVETETAMFESVIRGGEVYNFIAVDGSEPCGLCSFGRSQDKDLSEYAEIYAIHTKPEYWGKGVGKLLMDTALSELSRLGYEKAMLWVFEENKRARRFYERYGFVFDGTKKDSGFSSSAGNTTEVRYRLEQIKNGGITMYRSMMQVFVKGSKEALELYQKAFNAEVLCTYEDGNGGYMHAELNACGQVIAVSEINEDVKSGNTMMFCFEMGDGNGKSNEEQVRHAYEVLKEGAIACSPLTDSCGYSPLQFVCTDKFGVTWCIFV